MTSYALNIGTRLRTNFHNPIVRKNVSIYMFGKLLGLGLAMAIIALLVPSVAAHAQDGLVDQASEINAINTMWVLISAFLVFGMQVGFVMLEAGFARSRESVNILAEGIADTCICGLTFWAFGYAFMFGAGTPLIGTEGFFLQGLPATFGTTGVPLLAFWVFQFAFADTCSTITSGAMVGRTGFVGDLLYSVVVTGFIYPILGHWAWGPGGLLATMSPAGFLDFAGSTVVHTVGGVISLAGAIALGPRLGRVFKRDGGGPFPAHNIILGAAGGLILWFGWYGFNPGSTLSALDSAGVGRVAFNTTLAACSAGMAALLYSYIRNKTWDLGTTVNGFLAGLVAITAPCYWVDPIGAFFIGIGGVVFMIVATELLEWFRVDDPIGAVPVHMAAGIWGTIALGLFASGQYGFATATGANTSTVITGLFYGGGTTQLAAQVIGSLVITSVAMIASLILMYAVKATGTLRLSAEDEIRGLDVAEHGMPAYPEFILHPHDGTPKTLDSLNPELPAGAAAVGD